MLEQQRTAIADTRSKVRQERGAAENAVRDCTRDLANIEATLAGEGGTPFEQRGELELQQRHLESQLASIEQQLRDFADGPAPLLLVAAPLDDTYRQAQREQAAAESGLVNAVLAERDEWLLTHFQSAQIGATALAFVQASLEADRERRAADAAEPGHLDAPRELQDVLAGLRQETLTVVRERIAGLLDEWERTTEALETAVPTGCRDPVFGGDCARVGHPR